MNALLFGVIGAVTAAGLVLLAVALSPNYRDPEFTRTRSLSSRIRKAFVQMSRRTRMLVIIGVAAGIISAAVSGIIVTAFIVPAAIIGLPTLLGKQDTRERDLLSALEAWSRALSSATATSSLTLREVFGVTRESTPAELRVGVDRMYRRMSSSWTNADALRAFADEMDDVWVDEVVIYLIQAAQYSPGGLADALEGIADNLANQVKLRMNIYLEREKPRRVLVQMTIITVVVLAGTVLLARTPQLEIYSTPFGQMILLIIAASCAALLLWAKGSTRVTPEPRLVSERVSA
ncbi:type II secretion system F family protein [Plantibacter sp. VKM Ac-2880]|uniref:type II secretion system F family protein n=1 Tax=Plantibacter sp. VKM Ac-2880 TaxID=2783827 RepID=UPI00188FEE72|nr:type II secretion system F family protein [Plantibacter sp. VKM Ac-2880]